MHESCVLENFLQSQKKNNDLKPFFDSNHVSTSRYISKMKIWCSFINVKTLEQILDPCPFFPSREKSTVLQERDCVLGEVFRSLFSVEEESGRGTCTVGKGAWER